MEKITTKFCWHCARKLQGNHFAEYESENGKVTVHKACKVELQGGFNSVLAVDDAEYDFYAESSSSSDSPRST